MAQGVLGFQFEADETKDGATGFGGLGLYLELMQASGLCGSARHELQVCGEQGWLDVQMLISALALNLAGGDCVDDLKRLEADSGFASLLAAAERRLLSRRERQEMEQRWRRGRAEYRFLAIREPLRELALEDEGMLPFPVADFAAQGRYKLFGVVTNRRDAGEEVIRWHRERCGKSEEVHAVLKSDLAGGWMPSGLFGANAAWWAITIMAHNLNAAMKKLVLGPGWAHCRMKALRFHLIALPGRVVRHARRQIVRLSAAADTLAWIVSAQRRILALARAMPG